VLVLCCRASYRTTQTQSDAPVCAAQPCQSARCRRFCLYNPSVRMELMSSSSQSRPRRRLLSLRSVREWIGNPRVTALQQPTRIKSEPWIPGHCSTATQDMPRPTAGLALLQLGPDPLSLCSSGMFLVTTLPLSSNPTAPPTVLPP
jgi:hypothetical protein